MSSSFSGLTNASRALNAAQYAITITGENLTNANTTGYVRQRADMTEVVEPGDVSRISSTADRTDGGVTANSATRLNDVVIDNRQRTEHGLNSYASTKADALSQIEGVYDEPSDNGLAEQMNTLWSDYASLASSPGGTGSNSAQGVRDVVISQASKVASSINSAAGQLSNISTAISTQLNQTVANTNTAATQLANVNKQIANAVATGTDWNALADQRDQLTLKLSELTGASTTIGANGAATVTLPDTGTGSVTLVDGSQPAAAPAVLTTDGTAAGTMVGTTVLGTTSGSLQGGIDSLTTVATYQSQLNGVAKALADKVNAAQQNGTDYYGNDASTSTPVSNLFSYTAGNEAATLTLATTDPSKLAAAEAGQPAGTNDGSNAATVSNFGKLSDGPDALYSAMIGNIGSASSAATQAATVQGTVTTNVDNLQQSAAGVNMDEETTNLLIYQRQYQASARVLSTVDEMLDQLINHTGRAGL